MCLAQGHNTVTLVGFEPRTSRFGVRRSTTIFTVDGASKLQEVVNLPQPVLCCLSALIHYLRDFKLEKVLQQTQ